MLKNKYSTNTRKRCINNRNGTDGCRLLCHQFSPSSLPRPGNCISRYNIFWLKINYFKGATLLSSSTEDQDRNSRTIVFQLNFGRH